MNTTINTFRSIRNSDYRDLIERINDYIDLCAECPTDNVEVIARRNNKIADLKRTARRLSRRGSDRYSKPVTETTFDNRRYVYPYENDPDVIDFWFESDNGETDEEIDEYVDSVLRTYCYGTYSNPDGAGLPFTSYVHWKRTPYGIRFIRCNSINI